MSRWVVCQLGAREHYAIARCLASNQQLAALCTDIWVPSTHLLSRSARLCDRYDPSIPPQLVAANTWSSLSREVAFRLQGLSAWELAMKRNAAFQAFSAQTLRLLASQGVQKSAVPIVFAYSYAAREIFSVAKNLGWRTVLGQIDPGPKQFAISRELAARRGKQDQSVSSPPDAYWNEWRHECETADLIVVNSRWSARCLNEAGVSIEKLRVVPLSISAKIGCASPLPKTYTEAFSEQRKLRVLFLGQLTPMKGLLEILAAAKELASLPVEFVLVGPRVPVTPLDLQETRNVQLPGAVPRSEVGQWYAQADVFLFPSHSDGFGLTQLEASSYGLPIIASDRCGEVVVDGENGLLLPTISTEAIVAVIKRCLSNPSDLRKWSAGAMAIASRFGEKTLATNLNAIAGELQ
jgi:glycosyltransferase involved in cell wall biosynthesis